MMHKLFVALLCELLVRGQSTDPGPSQLGPALQLERETRWLSARVLQVGYPGAEVAASTRLYNMTQANPAPLKKHAAKRCIRKFLIHGASYYRGHLLRSLGELTFMFGSDSVQRERDITFAAERDIKKRTKMHRGRLHKAKDEEEERYKAPLLLRLR